MKLILFNKTWQLFKCDSETCEANIVQYYHRRTFKMCKKFLAVVTLKGNGPKSVFEIKSSGDTCTTKRPSFMNPGDQKQKTKGPKNQSETDLPLKKNQSLRQLHQKIKTARHRQPLKKMRLQGPRKLAKILRDPNFLKEPFANPYIK